jgi:hypothetical protein
MLDGLLRFADPPRAPPADEGAAGGGGRGRADKMAAHVRKIAPHVQVSPEAGPRDAAPAAGPAGFRRSTVPRRQARSAAAAAEVAARRPQPRAA